MPFRGRFAAVYAALALVLAAAAAGTVVTLRLPPAPSRHCWASAPELSGAIYSAAFCRFGKANVSRLGWMPHIGPDGYASGSIEEVAVIHTRTAPSYWLARVRLGAHQARVEDWTVCGAGC